ncbi:MAG: hypothetical protein H5T63_06935 [Chloroflexi bacterium]|nr:hypothetical protein [Chloroflexota bacterium]
MARTSTPVPSPVPTPSPTMPPTPTLPPLTLVPTPTSGAAYLGEIEGLVMSEDSQLLIGVRWLSKSRITYVVVGGEVDEVKKFLGETARVTGEIVDRGPWLKEIVVRKVEASTDPHRLSRRTGYIKELGPSIYMQGTHVLVDREGKPICLLSAAKTGLDLDAYMTGKVTVYGVITKTVEGDAQIMEVELVERAKP